MQEAARLIRRDLFAAGLWLVAGLTILLVMTVPGYLLVRAVSGGPSAWALLTRPETLSVAARSVALAATVTALAIAIAVPLAWLTVRSDMPLRRLWSVLTVVPLVVPSYVAAYLFRLAFGSRGALQAWLEPLGVTTLPQIQGFTGSSLVLALYTYPYCLLLVRAALLRLDPALEEAARTLGDTPWRAFTRVTLPQLKPALAAGGLLVALYTLRDFGAVSIMRFDSFTRILYVQYRSTFDRSSAATLALLLVAIAAVILVAEMKAEGRAQAYRRPGYAARPARRVSLGLWRWPATAACASLVLVTLVAPAALLAQWFLRSPQSAAHTVRVGEMTVNSVMASGLGAATTLAVALPLAWLSVRRPGRVSRVMERAAYMGFALPGIVVALALVFLGARLGGPLYQSLAMLVLAYVILFLPQAVGAARTALLQLSPALEESARSLGKGPTRVMTSVTLPLIGPGLAAGFGLVFLTALKELPATLILSPIGFATLSVGIWSSVSEAYFAQAAAPALTLVAVSAVPTIVLVLRTHGAPA